MIDFIAGIVASDGHLDKDSKRIRIISKNKIFLEEIISPILKEITHKNVKIYSDISGFGKVRYVLSINEKNLWNILVEKYNIPPGKKADRIKPPHHLSFEEQIEYVKGWFAGEGSPSRDVHKKHGKVYTFPQVEIWIKNESMIFWIHDILRQIGIFSTVFYSKKKKQWLLLIRRKESLNIFKEKIDFLHPIKAKKFENLLRYPRISTS